LRRHLANAASWQLDFTPNSTAIIVSGIPRNARRAFELLNLALTAPRIDTAAFQKWQQSALRARNDPFELAVGRAVTQRHPRARPMTGAVADSVNADSVLAFYKARLGDAGRMTFVIAGNVSLDSLRPLVERYLGSLPGHAGATPERPRDLGIRPPAHSVDQTVVGDDSASKTRVVITVPFPYTTAAPARLDAAAQVIEGRLRERLREQLSGTYGVSVQGTATDLPYAHAQLFIAFTSEPERTRELQTAMFAVLDTLAIRGVTEEEVGDAREVVQRRHEHDAQEIGYWLGGLEKTVLESEPVEAFVNRMQHPETITAEDMNATLHALLDSHTHVLVTSLPVRLAPQDVHELTAGEW
jgi:zinc protease